MFLNSQSEIGIVTFATFGNSRKHRDYSRLVNRLRSKCDEIGLDLAVFSFENGNGSADVEVIRRKLPMRKGAGYWSWKADAIKLAVKHTSTRYILYVDCDLDVRGLPDILSISGFTETGVAVFKTKERLIDWTSTKCLENFSLTDREDLSIVGASTVLIDCKNANSEEFLNRWDSALSNYRNLLDPFWTIRLNHRHDQSILSCLIASSQVQVSFVPPGFFGSGLDNGALKPGDAWIIHGEVEALSVAKMSQFFSKAKTFIYHKFELGLFLFMQQLRSIALFQLWKIF